MKRSFCLLVCLLALLLVLNGCGPRQVEKEEAKVTLEGEEVVGVFSGTLENGVPNGEGTMDFTEEDSAWSFEGTFNEGTLGTGKIKDKPITITLNGKEYTGTYEGEALGAIPQGQGAFQENGGEQPFKYEGNFQDGQPAGAGKVSPTQMTITWDEEEYLGEYEGEVVNGLPEGTGSFSYKEDEDYLEYEGGWKAGAMAGEGSLESNVITIHFSDTDKEGTYKGDVLDGMPSGEGEFAAADSEGNAYSYKGEWKDGVYNGQGVKKTEEVDTYVLDGTFTNGEYTPTPLEAFIAQGSLPSAPYRMFDSTAAFIEEHEELFTANSKEGLESLIDTSFDYKKFAKNPEEYEPQLIKLDNLKIVQVHEQTAWGYNLTFARMTDSKDRVYSMLFLNEADGIYEGDKVTLYALPLDYYTYPNIYDTDIWAISLAGVYIEK